MLNRVEVPAPLWQEMKGKMKEKWTRWSKTILWKAGKSTPTTVFYGGRRSVSEERSIPNTTSKELGRGTPALLKRAVVVLLRGPEHLVGDGWTALTEPGSRVDGNQIPK